MDTAMAGAADGAMDPQMAQMVELVKKYVAEGMPRPKAVALAMQEVQSGELQEPAMEQAGEVMSQGVETEAMPMPTPAPAGQMNDPMELMKQIAMAKRSAR